MFVSSYLSLRWSVEWEAFRLQEVMGEYLRGIDIVVDRSLNRRPDGRHWLTTAPSLESVTFCSTLQFIGVLSTSLQTKTIVIVYAASKSDRLFYHKTGIRSTPRLHRLSPERDSIHLTGTEETANNRHPNTSTSLQEITIHSIPPIIIIKQHQ